MCKNYTNSQEYVFERLFFMWIPCGIQCINQASKVLRIFSTAVLKASSF